MLGLVMATVMMAVLVQTGQAQPRSGMEFMLLVLAGVWVVAVGASVAIKGVFISQARSRWEGSGGELREEDLAPAFAASTIMRAALIEAPGLFGAVAFLVSGNAAALVAPLLSLAALGLLFPTDEKFRAFMRDVTGGT